MSYQRNSVVLLLIPILLAGQVARAEEQWQQLRFLPIKEHAAAFDTQRQVLWIFGGKARLRLEANDQLWRLDPAQQPPTWREVAVVGQSPRARNLPMIYLPSRDELVVVGPTVWALPLSGPHQWRQVLQWDGPEGGHTAVLMPGTDRVLVFGGIESGGGEATDLLAELDLDDSPGWIALAPSGQQSPQARSDHAAVYDVSRDCMWVHGGVVPAPYGASELLGDVWQLVLTPQPEWVRWGAETDSIARYGHQMVLQPETDRLVLIAGRGERTTNDLWFSELSGPTLSWSPIPQEGPRPRSRFEHTVTRDPATDLLYLVGGAVNINEYFGDAWKLTSADTEGVWYEIAPSGYAEDEIEREEYPTLLDVRRNQLLAYVIGDRGRSQTLFSLPLEPASRWAALVSGVEYPPEVRYPPSRVALLADPARDAVIVVTSQSEGTSVWRRGLADGLSWELLETTASQPTSIDIDHVTLDTIEDRLLVLDDRDARLWSLPLSRPEAWQPFDLGEDPRGSMVWTRVLHDDRGHRLLVICGQRESGGEYVAKTWSIEFDPNPHWVELPASATPPVSYNPPRMAYDAEWPRLLVATDSLHALDVSSPTREWYTLAPRERYEQYRAPENLVLDEEGRRALLFWGADDTEQALTLDSPYSVRRHRYVMARPDSARVELTWAEPIALGTQTLVRFSTEGFPAEPREGEPLPNGGGGIFPPTGGEEQTFVHANLDPTQVYHYSFFVQSTGPVSSAPRHVRARPSPPRRPGLQLGLLPNPALKTVADLVVVSDADLRPGSLRVWADETELEVVPTSQEGRVSLATLELVTAGEMHVRACAFALGGADDCATTEVTVGVANQAGSAAVLLPDTGVEVKASGLQSEARLLAHWTSRTTLEIRSTGRSGLPRGRLILDTGAWRSVGAAHHLAWEHEARGRLVGRLQDGILTTEIVGGGRYTLVSGSDGDVPPEVPASPLRLLPSFPNPFNPHTTVRFELAEPTAVTLKLFDASGRLLRVLCSGSRPAGRHQVDWDGTDGDGNRVASGVYFLFLESRGQVVTGRVTLLK